MASGATKDLDDDGEVKIPQKNRRRVKTTETDPRGSKMSKVKGRMKELLLKGRQKELEESLDPIEEEKSEDEEIILYDEEPVEEKLPPTKPRLIRQNAIHTKQFEENETDGDHEDDYEDDYEEEPVRPQRVVRHIKPQPQQKGNGKMKRQVQYYSESETDDTSDSLDSSSLDDSSDLTDESSDASERPRRKRISKQLKQVKKDIIKSTKKLVKKVAKAKEEPKVIEKPVLTPKPPAINQELKNRLIKSTALMCI